MKNKIWFWLLLWLLW